MRVFKSFPHATCDKSDKTPWRYRGAGFCRIGFRLCRKPQRSDAVGVKHHRHPETAGVCGGCVWLESRMLKGIGTSGVCMGTGSLHERVGGGVDAVDCARKLTEKAQLIAQETDKKKRSRLRKKIKQEKRSVNQQKSSREIIE